MRALFLICFSLVGFQYLWHCHKCSFYPENIHAPLNLSCGGKLPPLKQHFYYLGEGRQCFAFESEDHQMVIKFFKARHLKRKHWLKESVFGKRRDKRAAWKAELMSTALRYKLAQERIPEETGILLLHFNQTSDLNKKITIFSKFHIPYEIDLDKVPFILQEKAEAVPQRIDRLLKSCDQEGAIQSILLLKELLVQRAKKGLTDQRQCFRVNYGFRPKGAMQIDVGQIKQLDAPEEAEIVRVTSNLKCWVQKNYPRLYPFVEKMLVEKRESS